MRMDFHKSWKWTRVCVCVLYFYFPFISKIFLFFLGSPHLAMLRAYFGLSTQESVPVGSWHYMGCGESNLGLLHTRQVPSPLCDHSGPYVFVHIRKAEKLLLLPEQWMHVIIRVFTHTDKMSTDNGPKLIMMCLYRYIHSSKWTVLVVGADNKESYACFRRCMGKLCNFSTVPANWK